MRLDPGQIEVVDDAMASVLRGKSGAERLEIAGAMFSFARELIESSIREAHPDWDEGQIRAETAKRISHGNV